MEMRIRREKVRFSRTAWVLLGSTVLLLLAIQYAFKAVDDRSAILRWRPQILELTRTNIYERYNYPNPPIMPLLLLPFAALPPLACSLGWFLAKVGMTIASCHWIFRVVESPQRPFPGWAVPAVVLLGARPIIGDLSHGNVNLFILFLVAGGLYAFSRHRDLTAGVILGLAVACKVTPALFIPYFAWKRAWTTVGGCVVGLVLFLFVVPGACLGMGRNVELLTSWYDGMVRPFVVDGQVTTEHINQSLPGLAFRLGTHSPSFYEKGVAQGYSNIVSLDPRLVAGLVKLCMGVFAAMVIWCCRTPIRRRGGWRLAAEYGLVILGMLLFSERTWKHHCVTLLLPFAVLVYYVAVFRDAGRVRRYLVGSLGGAAVLMASTLSPGPGAWARIAKLSEADGAYVWAYLLLTVALLVVLRRDTPALPAVHSLRAAA